MRNKPVGAAVYGIDLGKSTYHVVGTDSTGHQLQRVTLSRSTIFTFSSNAAAALIGMEACPGSQWLARRLEALDHTVRIISAQFVKPYVKSNKNDLVDAAAIAEAVTRPSVRFGRAKSTEQAELQPIHRIRDRLIACRTQLINQIRAFCLEFGVTMHAGISAFKAEFPKILGDESKDLTPRMRALLCSLSAEMTQLDECIGLINRDIDATAR